MKSPSEFEEDVRLALSAKFGSVFTKRSLDVLGVKRSFDAVSEDGTIVADAKRQTWGRSSDSGKLAHLSELVFSLGHLNVVRRLVICPDDGLVALLWLKRCQPMSDRLGVEFLALGADGELRPLRWDSVADVLGRAKLSQ